MYAKFGKRVLDFTIAFLALIVLFPVLLILMMLGWFFMSGNPFFVQARPGRKGNDGKERIFNLIKFRTMSNKKDKDGNLLPDDQRLNAYGKFLRSTSLDELPELYNILAGDMSLVGPRPLLVEYLPYYTEEERHRHDVRPGLTGWAQINGRNGLEWEKRFQYDVHYVKNISLSFDTKIIFMTIGAVLNRKGVHENAQKTEGNMAKIRESKKYYINEKGVEHG